MGRKDLSDVRTQEILDAFEVCIVRYGVDGTSLEQIAEEAGLKRSMLRHYVGNRDDLIHALAERVAAKHMRELDEMAAYLPGKGAVERVIECLFPETPWESPSEQAVVAALFRIAERYPRVGQLMRDSIDRMHAVLAEGLCSAYPQAASEDVRAVAFGIGAISFDFESLALLGSTADFRERAVGGALRLIGTLDASR